LLNLGSGSGLTAPTFGGEMCCCCEGAYTFCCDAGADDVHGLLN